MWQLETLDINGGFLPGLSLALPPGLTCIIGPRGSGKSTLAEAIRYAFTGTAGATRQRLDLLQANLGANGLITATAKTHGGPRYIIKRAYKQQAIITSEDSRSIHSVDLDRGTFLPLDAYSSVEIESIADETLGEKRRTLLDDLRAADLQQIQHNVAERRRALESNADRINAQRRVINDLTERIEEIGDVRARLSALASPADDAESNAYIQAARQQKANERELNRIALARQAGSKLYSETRSVLIQFQQGSEINLIEPGSSNSEFLEVQQQQIDSILAPAIPRVESAVEIVAAAMAAIDTAQNELLHIHEKQAAAFTLLSAKTAAASELVRARASLEHQIAQLEQAELEKVQAVADLDILSQERGAAKARYLSEREKVSDMRQLVAEGLQRETGNNVRVRVMRNGDDFSYRQTILDGLRGARVRNHDEILSQLLTLRPEHLSQIIALNDLGSFEQLMGFGIERARKILDALRENLDPLALEITPIDDRVNIELNVSTGPEPNYRDAAELSRGQKCTALLPLLLARRDSPLVIDQPEDNLDNHFIFETVVESILRLKPHRQMIFITHNANIPVLAEAELIVVMNSDGKSGFIEKAGSLDQCQDEIIDLLEGGREAFELRRQRYARH